MSDHNYVVARNKLIPHATKVADRVAGKHPRFMENQTKWVQRWNKAYLGEMDRLAKELKLAE